jgi:uncharacterized protein DUF6580
MNALRRPMIQLGLADLWLASGLIGLDVAARLLPHPQNFSPLVATALFGGALFRARPLVLVMPLVAMAAGDAMLGFYDWRVMATVYAAICVPAGLGLLARRFPAVAVWPLAIASSLVFFATTNFAVWAFGTMYSHDVAGLTACYLAALPFLKNALAGDLFWTALLFVGLWMVQSRRTPALPTTARLL